MDDTDEVSVRFEAHVGPVRDALQAMIEAEHTLTRSRMLPDASSQAMAELNVEKSFAGPKPWGADPVSQAHYFGQLLVFSATDMGSALCQVLRGETPVFAHMALARAAIEHAGRAWLLLDPNINVNLRVARGMNDRLFAMYESSKLKPLPLDSYKARIDSLLEIATEKGFELKGKPPLLTETRMTATDLTAELLGDDDEDSFGSVIYRYFSAVTHGTAYGLTQSLEADHDDAPKIPGVTMATLFTSSGAACTVVGAVILALSRALDAKTSFFGWSTPEFAASVQTALRASKAAVHAREIRN